MTIYKTKVSKEDFKKSMTECFKTSWIFSSEKNLLKSIEWLKNKEFEYNLSIRDNHDMSNLEQEEQETSAINVFKVYEEKMNELSEEERLKFFDVWENEGFDLVSFQGESIEDGNAVGEAARNLFELISVEENIKKSNTSRCIDFDDLTYNEAYEKTNNLIKNAFPEEHIYLFEPAFDFDNKNLKIRCDILKLKQNKHVEIIEVKGTSTVKVEHVYDLMYQKFVLEKNGFIVDDVKICHINSSYVLGSKNLSNINKKQLMDDKLLGFKNKNITFDIAKQNFETVKKDFKEKHYIGIDSHDEIDLHKLFVIDELSHGDSKNRPTILETINSWNETFSINEIIKSISNILTMTDEEVKNYFKSTRFCESKIKRIRNGSWIFATDESNEPYCIHAIEWFDRGKPSIFELTGLNAYKKGKIYWETKDPYLENHFHDFYENIALDWKGNYFLKKQHIRMMESLRKFSKSILDEDPSLIIDTNKKAELINVLKDYERYPIYMYDFETCKWAIPKFNKSWSYQQIPFQYSIDVIIDKNYDYNDPKTMKHFEFIGKEKNDPRLDFVLNFIEDIFSKGEGKYVAYNDSFEKSVLKYLAFVFPELEIPLMYIIENTIDLMDFFKGNKDNNPPWFLIYHPDFKGSYSIKKTQPALDPMFNYSDLTINKGDKASQVFRQYIEGYFDSNISLWKDQIEPDMIKYCNRDTLAMVVILKQVQLAIEKTEVKNEKI